MFENNNEGGGQNIIGGKEYYWCMGKRFRNFQWVRHKPEYIGKQTKMTFTLLEIYLSVACQLRIVREKVFYKTWTFDCSTPQHRGEMVYQTMYSMNKKLYQGIETEIS